MQDGFEEYSPILDPGYKWNSSCSKHEALKYLFGWIRGPLRDQILYRWKQEIDDPDETEMSLDEILACERELAVSDYFNAMSGKLGEKIIAEKLAELKRCDLDIEKAHRFLCAIDDELAKGEKSALRIDQHATENPRYPYITIGSLEKWALDEFDIHIFKHSQTGTMEGASLKGGLSKTKATNLQITFALLIEAFSKTASTYLLNDRPNIKNIAIEIVNLAKEDKRGLPGQSQSAVEKAIAEAIKIKKDPPIQ
jgi:hypothetical protein